MPRPNRALFVMPGFSRHAARRRGDRLEEFFNPLGVFERVVIASPGELARTELGSVTVEPLPAARALPWSILLGERASTRLDPLAEPVRHLAVEHRVGLLVQRYGGPLFHGLPAVRAARRLGLPALITLQNDYTAILRRRRPWARWARHLLDPPVWRYLFRHAAALWCVSDHVRSLALDAGAPADKLVTIPNKEDLGGFAAEPDPTLAQRLRDETRLPERTDRGAIFLSVGRLVPQKNYLMMLEAFAAFRDDEPNAVWVIVGQGPLREPLALSIDRLGLTDAVRFVDRDLAADELSVLYRAADALLFVSRFEGQGRVAYEAMACGTPVIGSRQPPITDMVIDGETGATADPDSVPEIVDAMRRVTAAAPGSLAEGCSALARRYDLDFVGPLEADLYRRLIADGNP
ncbi:MAG: glycosyltransferase [bacterium]|nr:glycosyltransferase [bacterium]